MINGGLTVDYQVDYNTPTGNIQNTVLGGWYMLVRVWNVPDKDNDVRATEEAKVRGKEIR